MNRKIISVILALSFILMPASAFATGYPDMTGWQWGFSNNGAMGGTYNPNTCPDTGYSAWNSNPGEALADVVVAVVDSGIDQNHSDLADSLWTGSSFAAGGDSHGFSVITGGGNSSTTGLTDGHGTMVAGVIAAEADASGISGLAHNAKLMSLRSNGSLNGILQCLRYAKTAKQNGVALTVVYVNCSTEDLTSSALNQAVTELGQLGVVCVFPAGDEAKNLDAIDGLLIAENPYALIVGSIKADGNPSSFSNYGGASVDIMAPGSTILTTSIEKQYMGELYKSGAASSGDRVKYTSFDSSDYNSFASFGCFVNNGQQLGSNIQYPLIERGYGCFDGNGVLAIDTTEDGIAAIISNEANLGGADPKPEYVSFRVKNTDNAKAAEPLYVVVPVRIAGNGVTIGGTAKIAFEGIFGTNAGEYAGAYAKLDLSGAEIITRELTADEITGVTIDWEQFSVVLAARTSDNSSGTLAFDSIALGSGLYPYTYESSTAMAAAGVSGVAALLSQKQAAILGTPGTADYAEKLVALVKAKGEKHSYYLNYCSNLSCASVDGNNLGPAIISVTDGAVSISIDCYFTAAPKVFFDDNSISSGDITSVPLGNDKYRYTVPKPSNYPGTPSRPGYSAVRVVDTNNGKEDNFKAVLAPIVLTQAITTTAASVMGVAFANGPIPVTTADIYNNLSAQDGANLVAEINLYGGQAYFTASKLDENVVPSADFNAISAAAVSQEFSDDMFWMDVSMFVKAGTLSPVQMNKVLGQTQATIGVPDFPELSEGYARTYKVFAYHANAPAGQELEVIDPTYNSEDNTLTFDISRCSTFAIAYKDTRIPSSSGGASSVPEQKIEFKDVPKNSWFAPAVEWAVKNNIASGTGRDTFSPYMNCSRAHAVTFLWKAAGSPVVNYAMSFSDVKEGDWYSEAVRWAASIGITSGYDNGAFGVNDSVTREQLAVFIYHYEQILNGGGFKDAWMFKPEFSDADSISSWAYEPVCWCIMNNILAGKGAGVLDPKGTATRAEVVQMLMNYLEK